MLTCAGVNSKWKSHSADIWLTVSCSYACSPIMEAPNPSYCSAIHSSCLTTVHEGLLAFRVSQSHAKTAFSSFPTCIIGSWYREDSRKIGICRDTKCDWGWVDWRLWDLASAQWCAWAGFWSFTNTKENLCFQCWALQGSLCVCQACDQQDNILSCRLTWSGKGTNVLSEVSLPKSL